MDHPPADLLYGDINSDAADYESAKFDAETMAGVEDGDEVDLDEDGSNKLACCCDFVCVSALRSVCISPIHLIYLPSPTYVVVF